MLHEMVNDSNKKLHLKLLKSVEKINWIFFQK